MLSAGAGGRRRRTSSPYPESPLAQTILPGMSQADDVDYDTLGRGYALQRRTEPRIAALEQLAHSSSAMVH